MRINIPERKQQQAPAAAGQMIMLALDKIEYLFIPSAVSRKIVICQDCGPIQLASCPRQSSYIAWGPYLKEQSRRSFRKENARKGPADR